MKKILLFTVVAVLFAMPVFAANGDMTVNGQLSVGTQGIKFSDNSVQTSASKLVWDYTVTDAPVSSVTITGLDGNAHGGYELETVIVRAQSIALSFYVNNDTTPTNYSRSYLYYGPTFSSATANDAVFSGIANVTGSTSVGHGNITITPGGFVMFNYNELGAGDNYSLIFNIRKNAAVTNLTRIDLVGSLANGIGVGSRFRLWKKM